MTTSTEATSRPGLYRLLAWLSPNFPTGAFSYSHGLEAAAAAGSITDRTSLEAWIAAILSQGSGRIDAAVLCAAHRAAAAADFAALDQAHVRGVGYRATAELALENSQQGAAFLTTCRAAWPEPFIEEWAAGPHSTPPPQAGEGDRRASDGRVGVNPNAVCLAAVFGAYAARAGIALEDALTGYLGAFAANLVAAGLRLGLIGQTDGQRILAALEPIISRAAAAALAQDSTDFGAATTAVDLASMAHETQYTRLFRS